MTRETTTRRSPVLAIPVFLGTLFLLSMLFFYLLNELLISLQVLLVAATLGGVFLVGAFVILGLAYLKGWWKRSNEKVLQEQEETRRRRLENDAIQVRILVSSKIVHTADPGQQVYLIDALRNLTTPLHLTPGQTNGHQAPPALEEVQRWQVHQLAHGKRNAGELPAAEATAQIGDGRPELLEALAIEQRLLLVGPSGSGKSSVLRRIVAMKLPLVAQILLCDPHGSRPKWGASIDAIGFGEDFEAILEAFQQLEWLHQQRIREVAQGAAERSFPITLCVIEETQALVEHFTRQKVDIGHYIKMFLTRTRKTGIDVLVVTQTDSVKALGLEGFGRNRDAFAGVRTSGRDGRGHKVEYINEHQERFVYDAPPLWPDSQPVGVSPHQVARLTPAPTAEQYQVIDVLLKDPGASDYKISMEVWGKKGSSYKAKIDEVKALFGPF
jgi:hypothetical protein